MFCVVDDRIVSADVHNHIFINCQDAWFDPRIDAIELPVSINYLELVFESQKMRRLTLTSF